MRSLLRTWAVARLDLRTNLRRPLFWIWLLLVALVAWGFSGGAMRIQSGDSDVGGVKAYITSEFANAQILSILVLLLHGFFVAIGAGMTVLRDDELRVGAVIHATPLGPREYVWGKYLAALASFLVLLAAHVGLSIFFNHAVTGAAEAEFIGPLDIANYVRPMLVFALPAVLFVAGVCFWVGERSRRPILVFFLPVALLLFCAFFLWNWSPSWLAQGWNRLLMLVEPTGHRWLREEYLIVDRGVEFYNEQAITFDRAFLASRAALVLLGLLAPLSAARHFARTLRGRRARKGSGAVSLAPQVSARPELLPRPLVGLAMRARRPGVLAGLAAVTRVEFKELVSSPGIYLFLPLIVLETVAGATFLQGPFDTPVLLTSGIMAVNGADTLALLTCLLLLFYTVESLRREEATGLASLHHATPIRTFSLLLGKAFANSLVGALVIATSLVSSLCVLLYHGDAPLSLEPFALVWLGLLVPTFLVWSSFVALVYSLTRSRYTSYAIGAAAIIWTFYKSQVGEMDWRTNWLLSGVLQWSDFGQFELVRTELLLNRALALLATILFTVLTVKFFPRRSSDSTNTLLRMRPWPLCKATLWLTPVILPPVVLAVWLGVRVEAGFQGEAAEKAQKDYWRKNVNTWKGGRWPDLAGVDVELDLHPERHGFEAKGTFVLRNEHDEALRDVALTRGLGWRYPDSLAESSPAGEDVPEGPIWTLDGAPFEPRDDAGLIVFELEEPLAPGASIRVGFHHSGEVPGGATKNGGGNMQFIVPSAVVLGSFSPTFVPVVGYVEGIGVDEDNRSDAKEFPPDFYEGVTRSLFGGGSAPYPVRTVVRAPEDFIVNGVGVLESHEVADGVGTWTWETDSPVRFFNVVASNRWTVTEGEHGTAIYHLPEHGYNIPAMIEALDGARVHFSEWFHPYPWEGLKLSQFPALAGYAQGFPTNITFSENIGFLTRADDADADAPFMVTAHETAHQWWGNILTPGEGPGGNLLSEGTAHYSTLMLFEEMRGPRGRIAFAKNIEDSYGEARLADSERPMVKVDGSRPGDTTVTYDKAGFVFWMMMQHMGRERFLEGVRSFIAAYVADRDHPVLQDFVRHLRPFAADAAAYDAFTQQWFFEVVVPEYRIEEPELTEVDGAWRVTARVENVGTGVMPVEVGASAGERFPEDGEDAAPTATDELPYREARQTVTLGPNESAVVEIVCDFLPERLVVDPDVRVLQLRRKLAVHEF